MASRLIIVNLYNESGGRILDEGFSRKADAVAWVSEMLKVFKEEFDSGDLLYQDEFYAFTSLKEFRDIVLRSKYE